MLPKYLYVIFACGRLKKQNREFFQKSLKKAQVIIFIILICNLKKKQKINLSIRLIINDIMRMFKTCYKLF